MSLRSIHRLWPQYTWATFCRCIVLGVAFAGLWWLNSYIAGFVSESTLRDIQFLVLSVISALFILLSPGTKSRQFVVPMPPRGQAVYDTKIPLIGSSAMSPEEWQQWVKDHSNGK